MNYKKFLNQLSEETGKVVNEDKEVAKEDALSMIAEFVKDVKKKFSDPEDRIDILKAASKTLEFYIDEIEDDDDEDDDEDDHDDDDSFDDDFDTVDDTEVSDEI